MAIRLLIILIFLLPVSLYSQLQVSVGTGVTYHHLAVQYETLFDGNEFDLNLGGEVSYTINNKYLLFGEYRYSQIERKVELKMLAYPHVGVGLYNHALSLGVGLKVTDWLTFKTGYFTYVGSDFKNIYSIDLEDSTLDSKDSRSQPFSGQGSQVSLVYTSPIRLSLEFVVNLMLAGGDAVRVDHLSTYSLLMKSPLIWRKDK